MAFRERMVQLRKTLGLSQQAFADRIGVKRNTVSKYEYEEDRNPEGPVITLICKEFHVSRAWLLNGEGEMFVSEKDGIVEEAAEKYGLDGMDKEILRVYLSMGEDGRSRIRRAVAELLEVVMNSPELMEVCWQERTGNSRPMTPEEIEERTEEYRNMLKGISALESLHSREPPTQETTCADCGPPEVATA